MATNFNLLGIGGSGSKAMSAFVHCAAAGLTPPTVTVSLLDQDNNNGNVSETASLITTYRRLHRDLGKKLPKTPDQAGLFSCDIVNPANAASSETPQVWLPLGERTKTMQDHFDYPRLRPELAQLARALFNQKEEIELQLDRGFRGRPAVGAVVLSSLTEEHRLHKYLDAVANANGAKQRVFLMGSVFGGMGASGIPTVARTLRRLRHGSNGIAAGNGRLNDTFAIGAGTLLPYFEFPDPPVGSTEANETAVRATEIPWASRLALEYYHTQIAGEGQPGVFDHLYLVGQQPLTSVGYFSTGAGGQNNPALLPELLTALAGCHFFASEQISPGQILRASHRENRIGWDDLPRVWSTDGGHEVRSALARLLRFAFAYHFAYFSCIYGGDSKKYRHFDWFRTLIGSDGLNDSDKNTALELNRYCTLLLRWIATICFSYEEFGSASETSLDFCKARGFAEPARRTPQSDAGTADTHRLRLKGDDERSDAKKDRATIQLTMKEMRDLQAAFGDLTGGEDEKVLDLHRIYDALERSARRMEPGLPAFVDALWRACSVLPNRKMPKPPRWWQQ